jgi:glutathione peroxidase
MPNPTILAGLFGLAAAAALFAAIAPSADAEPGKTSPLEFTVKDIDGKEVDLAKKYKGNVVLMINTASRCGYTKQYATLEALYQKYKDKGLRIAAFPSNDFGGQEPGSEKEIKVFCTTTYKTSFDLYGKVATKGENASPVYRFLTGAETNGKYAGPIEWNFTKFLVGRDGKVIGRFKSNVDPMSPEFTAAVENALKAAPPAK